MDKEEIKVIEYGVSHDPDVIFEEIDKTLKGFLADKNKWVGQLWALQQGFKIEYYSCQLSSYLAYPPQTIRDALLAKDRLLYKKCIEVMKKGQEYLSKNLGDVLVGGSVKTSTESVDEEGRRCISIIRREISPEAKKKLFNPQVAEELSFLSKRDEMVIESHFGITEEKLIIPEKSISRQMRSLQSYQFHYFEILRDYLDSSLSKKKIECKSDTLILNLVGGYQSGKTVAANFILAYMINVLANNKRITGDYMIMSAKMSSLHRNVINRICALYPQLTPPSINSTCWNLGFGVKISLLTTQLISFHSLKGCSLSFCYVDEIDSMHSQVLDLLQTRFTEKFDVGKGEKCVLVTTSNPQSPDHHITKFLYPTDLQGNPVESCVTKRVSTLQNTCVSDEYIKRMTIKCGGTETNKYKREIEGYSVHLSSENSVFNINEEVHFTNDTIDSYTRFTCPKCSDLYNPICKDCKILSDSVGRKDFVKVNIGLDEGHSVQRVFCATFFYIEDNKTKAIVLDELVYEGGDDKRYATAYGYDALLMARDRDIIDLISRCKNICNNVEIFYPHDAPQKGTWLRGLIEKHSLFCKVSSAVAINRFPLAEAIRFMDDLFTSKSILISNSCKNLKSQLFSYHFDPKKIELGQEMPEKGNDHSV